MAWFPTVGGLENIIETVLWTNPSPTSEFTNQAVTLSDNISHYDYLIIKVQVNTNVSDYLDYCYDTNQIVNSTLSGNLNTPVFGVYANSYFYYRFCFYVSDTSLTFTHCIHNTSSGTASATDGAVIPVQIIGVKYGIELPKPAWELGEPDVTDAFTVNPTETHSITVTREPRYIQLYRTVSNSTLDYGYSCIYDVKNNKFRYIGATTDFNTGTSKNPFLGDVTSSVVQVKGASSGSTVYKFAVAIWY